MAFWMTFYSGCSHVQPFQCGRRKGETHGQLAAGRGKDSEPRASPSHLGEGQLGGQCDAFFGQQFLLVLCQHQFLAVPSPRSQQVGGCQGMLLLWKKQGGWLRWGQRVAAFGK